MSYEAVLKKLEETDPEKAPGDDSIHPVILRKLARQIAKPLSMMFTSSLKSSQIPQDWRLANVTPIFKKGSKKLASNYRPISLTSQVCKIMEKLIKGRIIDHLNANSLINDSQHGFTAGRSCLTNLLTFLESLTFHVDQGLPVDVRYLDFSKAFDKFPHQRLISKLRAHGIGPEISRWVENWLTDRKQRVTIKGTQSPWTSVTSGVPQGSVLGPTLFTIYINDIDENIKSRILKFADDTKLMAPVSNQEQITELQEDLASAFHWAGKWQMEFNQENVNVYTLVMQTQNTSIQWEHRRLRT